MLECTSALAEELDRSFPLSGDEHGLLLPPYSPGGWLKLRNLSGYKMNPVGIPNVGMIPKASQFMTKTHERLFSFILDRYFGKWRAMAGRLNKRSATGPPHFTVDPMLKMRYVHFFLQRASLIQQRCAARDWYQLYEETGLAMMSAQTRRYQSTDSVTRESGGLVPKERKVMTFEGYEVSADKRTPFEGFFTQRVRLAIAFSTSFGAFMQLIMQGYRADALKQDIYHHETPEKIGAKLNGAAVVMAGDVSKYDQNMPRFLIDLICERFRRDWHPAVAEMFLACVGAPLFVNEDRVGGEGRVACLGDPRKVEDYYQNYGFPSGVPFVSDVGKMIGAFVDIVPLIDLGIVSDTEEEWALVMDGQHPKARVLNSGDDFVIATSDAKQGGQLLRYFEEGQHPYFDVEVESPAAFLGNIICKDGSGVRVLPNITSWLVNTFGAERGIDSRFRMHWDFGWSQKRIYFGKHPLFDKVDSLLQKITRDKLGQSIDDLTPIAGAPEGLELRNYYDMTFVMNPDSVHYKINPEDVSASLLDEIYETIPSDAVAEITAPWRKGAAG